MCNRVTNHGDMSTFSKPASGGINPSIKNPVLHSFLQIIEHFYSSDNFELLNLLVQWRISGRDDPLLLGVATLETVGNNFNFKFATNGSWQQVILVNFMLTLVFSFRPDRKKYSHLKNK